MGPVPERELAARIRTRCERLRQSGGIDWAKRNTRSGSYWYEPWGGIRGAARFRRGVRQAVPVRELVAASSCGQVVLVRAEARVCELGVPQPMAPPPATGRSRSLRRRAETNGDPSAPGASGDQVVPVDHLVPVAQSAPSSHARRRYARCVGGHGLPQSLRGRTIAFVGGSTAGPGPRDVDRSGIFPGERMAEVRM